MAEEAISLLLSSQSFLNAASGEKQYEVFGNVQKRI